MVPNSKRLSWKSRSAAVVLAVAGLCLVQSGTALAATLPNDDFANATPVSALPFSDAGDLNGATVEPGEPQACNTQVQTIWYAFTPAASTTIQADVNGSDPGVVFNVYQQNGTGLSGLSFQDCIGYGGSSTFAAQAGTTYYFQVGSTGTGTFNFQFHVQQIPPPANDDFANATQVTAVPSSDTVSHPVAATLEPGEPGACFGGDQSGSVWWAFTPTASGPYSASVQGAVSGYTTLAAYQGSSLGGLSQVGCAEGQSVLTFQATAGVTYYIRAFGPWNLAPDFPLGFQIEATPPPQASFGFSPSDPSAFDTVQFFDQSYDPGQVGIRSEAWNFGDGTAGTGSFPAHHYTADGDYTATLTVTTLDGRTASASQVVHVRTHDVAITKFTVPTSASAGQTRSITVGVSDKRYPETVQVQLFTGNSQGGFDQVGTLTESVPVQTGKSTTPFAFSYTFTQSEAAVGKVTFEAVATIQGARDALPADNTALASTTVH
jgi:hypothetical protein